MILWNIRIEDSELANNNAALVGQTGKSKFMRGAEAVQNLLRIVGDDRDIYSPLFEASARLLQLDELASAVGSPIGASTKDQKKSRATGEIAKLSFVAVLIHKCEVRYFIPDLKTGGCAIVLGLNEILKLARRDLLATAQFFQDLCENLAVPGIRVWHRYLLGRHQRDSAAKSHDHRNDRGDYSTFEIKVGSRFHISRVSRALWAPRYSISRTVSSAASTSP